MAKLHSLLYREWRLARKAVLANFVVIIIFTLLYWLIALSLQHGNLKLFLQDSPEDLEMTLRILNGCAPLYFICTVTAFFVCADKGVHSADISSGWLRYSFGLPVSPVMRAAVFWVFQFMVLLGCFLFNVLNYCIACVVNGLAFRADVLLAFTVILALGWLLLIVQTVYPQSARTVSEYRNRQFISVAAMFALLFASILLYSHKLKEMSAELQAMKDSEGVTGMDLVRSALKIIAEPVRNFFHTAKYIAVPAILVLTVIGFLLSVKAFERRETP